MEQMMKKNRNTLLDFMKGIGCLGVVLVHFPFPGAIGKMLASVGVSAVVLFFLISGYMANVPEADLHKVRRRIKKNARICVTAILCYMIFAVIMHLWMGDFFVWTGTLADPMKWVRFFILGDFEMIYGDPLWFMPALVYAYLIIYLIDKYHLSKIAYRLLPLLILLRIGMETFTNTTGTDWHLSGNFLVGALPIMLLGHYIASKKDKIMELSVKMLLVMALLGTAVTFISVGISWKIDFSQVGKIWMATAFFLLALRLPQVRISGALEYLGQKLSLYIYIIHFAVGLVFSNIFKLCHLAQGYFYFVLPVVTILVSCLAAYGINKIATHGTNRYEEDYYEI